jgi:hypothetical protein
MAKITKDAIKEIENEIRDMINWVAVFETEYELPKEVVDKLKERLEGIASKLGIETL